MKSNRIRILLLSGLISCLFFSCRKDKNLHLDNGLGYFPAAPGFYVIYNVDSTVYDEFNHDTVFYKYQLKEYVESTFPDNEGRPSQRIERYVRNYSPAHPYDSIPWTLKNVWYSTRTASHGERVEANLRFVRLVFPVQDHITWNGNAQNSTGDWEYTYSGVNTPQTLGGLHFDSTATVIEKDETDLLNRRLYKEIYAKNVGLVSRQVLDVHDNQIDTIPVVNRIKGGVFYSAVVYAYGWQ